MTVVLERWNDDKMDALEAKVDRLDVDLREQRREMKAGFEKVDARFEKVDERFEAMRSEVTGRLDKMRNTMVYAVIAMSGTFVTGFGTLALILVNKS